MGLRAISAVVTGVLPAGAVVPGTVLHGRYVVGRCVGTGSYGVVHAAEDLRFEREVALKILHRSDAAAAYALKREFRMLRDLRHPRLVQLYELFTEATPFFFSMELVNGVDLVTAAGERPRAEALGLLAQVAEGLAWLHGAGLVHGDVKPSNALVRGDGRVALCDFGLAGRVASMAGGLEAGELGVGTVPYQSPEAMGGGGPASVAADWYAVGVMLFELYTGRRPFPGGYLAMQAAKVAGTIDWPTGAAGLDPRAETAIGRLLDPDPSRRGGGAVIRALAGVATVLVPSPPIRPPLVGRRAEREVLAGALAGAQAGRAVVVEVRGPSGIGKSALLDTFAAQVEAGGGVAMRSLCHLNEHVPFNAFDGIVDTLSQLLNVGPELRWPALPTPDATSLVTLFPVLGRAVGRLGEDEPRSGTERRLRGLTALRTLLARVGASAPTALLIDDAQWADADSLLLLRLLLAPPSTPPVVVVLAVRSDGVAGGLRDVLLAEGRGDGWPEWVGVDLGPLAEADTRELVRSVGADDAAGARAVRESGGLPILALELARFAGPFGAGPVDLAAALRGRVRSLPRGDRSLLEVCAVAGHPLPPRVALAAAGLGVAGYPSLLALQGAQLLRATGTAAEPQLDTYHEPLRTVVAGDLGEDRRRQIHLLVADAALVEGVLEPQFLTVHLEAAGDDRRAAIYAAAAAARAMDALAFAAAAHLYGLAARLGHEGTPVVTLRREQAAALALSGDGVASAETYELAASLVDAGPLQLELWREAAEQWLRAGRVEVGLERLRAVLAGWRLPWPGSTLAAVWTVLINRVRLRWGGVAWVERNGDAADPVILARADATWSATIGLNMLDLMRSAAFQAQHTRLALASGEPGRVARALSVEAVYIACEGGASNRAFADDLYRRAHALAERTGNRTAAAFANLTHGAAEVFVGRPGAAFAWLDGAEVALRERQVGAVWEVVNCQMYRAWAWWWQGEYARLVEEIPTLAIDARSRGDATAEVALASGVPNFTWLVLDDPREASTRTAHAIGRFPAPAFGSPHYFDLVARVNLALYEGRGEEAWRLVLVAWPKLRRVLLLNMQYFRIDLTVLRARAALAAGPVGATDAARQLRALAREDHPFGGALAATLGAPDGAALRAAVPGLEAAGLGGFAAAARAQLGEDPGWQAQRVVAPTRLARTLLPLPWAGLNVSSAPRVL